MQNSSVHQKLWNLAKQLDARLPWAKRGVRLIQAILFDLRHPPYYPPGHFYSPIPDTREALRCFEKLSDREKPVLGIDFNESQGRQLMDQFGSFYGEIPWKGDRQDGLRYFFDNDTYSYGDAIVLYSMLRTFRPKQYIEIGSGWSSCVAMDTVNRFLNDQTRCTFIEPNRERLDSLLDVEDKAGFDVQDAYVQNVDLSVFEALEKNDILFVDGSHVAKAGSDVNHVLFEILPRLKPGVLVHFHDVLFPFEYPEIAFRSNLWWNEAYMLRAFLSFNRSFEITFFATHLMWKHEEWFRENMPMCLKNPGGALWIRRTE